MMKSADLRELKVITAMDLEKLVHAGFLEVRIQEGAVITPSAREVLQASGLKLTSSVDTQAKIEIIEPTYGSPQSPQAAAHEMLLQSEKAIALKEEIMRVGRKLWTRGYVDGNGGNISARLTDELIICTPTLCSKADLQQEDFSLVDLEGKQLAGTRPRSSEVMLHLEIYKAQPKARGVVHCHAPHATAYAITGIVPPACIIPEQEIFVGSVALSPYETPGTKAFAETVVPYVKDHNIILLANHGVVSWADTVTHAEWYVEVVDTYCQTLILASHLGAPLTRIPSSKAADLLELKKKLGLPDPRFGLKECQLCDLPEFPSGVTQAATLAIPSSGAPPGPLSEEVESLIQAITDRIMAELVSR
jgi:L-fuculose-phosphate aldolase